MNETQTLTVGNVTNTGACVGTLGSGKKIFVLGALPNEEVSVTTTKTLSKFDEGVVKEVITPSKHRVSPLDLTYLQTSPWQITDIDYENELKADLIVDAYRLSGMDIATPPLVFAGEEYQYRSKYTFYVSQNGKLGVKARGNNEVIEAYSFSLARPEILQTAENIATALQEDGVLPSSIHSILVRSNDAGETFSRLNLIRGVELQKRLRNGVESGLKAVKSLPNLQIAAQSEKNRHQTSVIFENGSSKIRDRLNGVEFSYGINSFFQVNKPAYESALLKIQEYVLPGDVVDFYSGVGTIGISLGLSFLDATRQNAINPSASKNITLVDIDKENYAFAKSNALKHFGQNALSGGNTDLSKTTKVKVICASASKALEEIVSNSTLIVNPARNGLAKEVVQQILASQPKKVIYLSCNPSTQARDVSKLLESYTIEHLQGFNFFPKTPHIECLCVLKR